MKRILLIFASFSVMFLLGCSDESSYQNFSPKNSGFVVSFSKSPQEKNYPDVASATNIKDFLVEDGNFAFLVNYRTLNDEIIKNQSESEILEHLRNFGGVTNKAIVIYENDFKLQGKTAKDIIYRSQAGGQQRVRLVLNKNKVFAIIVSAIGADLKTDKKALKFLSSFKLTDFAEK